MTLNADQQLTLKYKTIYAGRIEEKIKGRSRRSTVLS